MKNALQKILLALQYLPYVLAGVQGVEVALSGAPGTTKKAAVLAAVDAAAKVGEQVPESHVQLISGLIDTVVSALNASGIFTHAATPAPTATAPPKTP